jgi:D-arabinose 1-dehydrogenase-like Zn-dependent alcohol dehydrogenase
MVKKTRESETPVKVGVRGLGGLGQMGIKILSTMNVEVFAISHSPNKEEEAKRIGANHFVLSSSVTAMNKLKRDHALDIILDTARHNSGYRRRSSFGGRRLPVYSGRRQPDFQRG